jgi:hypothetical protein
LKLPHAAALAIVDFSLIVPPLQKDDRTHVDMMAPFAQWVVEQRYDTEEACYQGRDIMMTLDSANLDKHESPIDRQRLSATCINSDDPRLTEKP